MLINKKKRLRKKDISWLFVEKSDSLINLGKLKLFFRKLNKLVVHKLLRKIPYLNRKKYQNFHITTTLNATKDSTDFLQEVYNELDKKNQDKEKGYGQP